jgi:hypothetical protein
LVAWLQTPEQHGGPAPWAGQPSPEARQVVLESSAHDPLSHDREQHSSSEPHIVPTALQIAPPHRPALHARLQQSCATSQLAPSARQYAAHVRLPLFDSQRALQHVERIVHGLPGAVHAPDCRQ